ncbi:mannosyltransferase OCH1-like enzyme [Mycoplana sp. BE70]|uniref:glycosyltransferase family 32 protein n=1 Tax=Mycoplana sp. BE70 TaxID=2817775 RepID=UPI002863B585|nr:glycosyltransferase [Mycoplana sp. BE70]MDR6755963.1 mannosyltransferase OCH1-like enzyme [Mycoplana sp. BE70]
MASREDLRARLKQAEALREEGRFEDALQILDAVAADPDNHLLGPLTVLGLPRKLHSAYLKIAKRQGEPIRRVGYQYTLVPPPELLARYGQFSSAERAALAEADRQPVPRIIHQVWIGTADVPVSTQAWADHAVRHGYEYRLWREADLQAAGFDRHPILAAMRDAGDLPGAVDVARYLILERFGGIYLDCDWYPTRRDVALHDVMPLVGLTALAEKTPRDLGTGSLLLTNSLIAAPPAHPVFRRILDALPDAAAALPDAPAWWSTGPLLFTVVCRGGAVTVTDAALVAGEVARRAPIEEVTALCERAEREDGGLLVAWKPW